MRKKGRGPQRHSNPDIFLSHSSKDKNLAVRLATDLNFCGVDVWLDEWEIQLGQSLVDVLGKAMDEARFVAILISENYNKSVWTKREYRKSLAREEQEGRIVMLPLILSGTEVPDFLEDKVYLDLRDNYHAGLVRITGFVHNISEFRLTRALREKSPKNMKDIWELLASIGFEPFVVVGDDDFDEILKHGGKKIEEDYAYFYPDKLLDSARVSNHIKTLLREVFPLEQYPYWKVNVLRAKAVEQ
jgi:hypothetical protein